MLEARASEVFDRIEPFMAARGYEPGGPFGRIPPGAELAAIREAAGDVRGAIRDSGKPDGVTTCDLVTLPYPTRFGLWRAGSSPAPFVWITNRMLVVQWTDPDATRRTLLWEASDHERGEYTPYFEGLAEGRPLPIAGDRTLSRTLGQASRFAPERLMVTRHGTVLGHLRALGIDPEDVDYVTFDHLHTQDVRRLVGTTRPAPDLGADDGPMQPWFPNARLITQVREWETIRHIHPLQRPWYQPETYQDLPEERLLFVDGDVLLGPGVALLFTPGHTAGNQSLALNTDQGIWVSSENGIAAECWNPRASRIPGIADWCGAWGQEVVLNANTLEFTAWQYDSMVAESLVADATPDGDFRLTFPSSELTAHTFSPRTGPTFTHGAIEHGAVTATAITVG